MDKAGCLVGSWNRKTCDYQSLEQIIRDAVAWARLQVDDVSICGGCFAFAGPVDARTGMIKLTNVAKLADQQLTQAQSAEIAGFPIVHCNDIGASLARLREPHLLDLELIWGVETNDFWQVELIENGTGLGNGFLARGPEFPNGLRCCSELAHVHVTEKYSFEDLLCGSRGFANQLSLIETHSAWWPKQVIETRTFRIEQLGPLVTQHVEQYPESFFSLGFVASYAHYFGLFARAAQLAHGTTACFLSGSVGRCVEFMRQVLNHQNFREQFVGVHSSVDVQRELRQSMPFYVVRNSNLTVGGACLVARSLFG